MATSICDSSGIARGQRLQQQAGRDDGLHERAVGILAAQPQQLVGDPGDDRNQHDAREHPQPQIGRAQQREQHDRDGYHFEQERRPTARMRRRILAQRARDRAGRCAPRRGWSCAPRRGRRRRASRRASARSGPRSRPAGSGESGPRPDCSTACWRRRRTCSANPTTASGVTKNTPMPKIIATATVVHASGLLRLAGSAGFAPSAAVARLHRPSECRPRTSAPSCPGRARPRAWSCRARSGIFWTMPPYRRIGSGSRGDDDALVRGAHGDRHKRAPAHHHALEDGLAAVRDLGRS